MFNLPKMMLTIFFGLIMVLDNFEFSVSGQSLAYHSSIMIDGKLYFLGGHPTSSPGNRISYLDLFDAFSPNQSSPLIKQLVSNSTIPSSGSMSLALGGPTRNTLYLICGRRGSLPGTKDYGSLVYSINASLFDTWVPETLDGQSQLIQISDTIYTPEDVGNTYITGYGDDNIYNFNANNLTFVTLTPINSGPLITTDFTCHLLIDKENIIYIGVVNLVEVYLYNIKENKWTTVPTVGDNPSKRFGHSSVLAPDGRIIVYGGTSDSDKLAILDTRQSPFRWTIPKNIVHPIEGNHYGHTSNLYENYMITAFGLILDPKNLTVNYYSSILVLDISDPNNYRYTYPSTNHNATDFIPMPTETKVSGTSSGFNKKIAIIAVSLGSFMAVIIAITVVIVYMRRSGKRRRIIYDDNNNNKHIDNEEKNVRVVVLDKKNVENVDDKRNDDKRNNDNNNEI